MKRFFLLGFICTLAILMTTPVSAQLGGGGVGGGGIGGGGGGDDFPQWSNWINSATIFPNSEVASAQVQMDGKADGYVMKFLTNMTVAISRDTIFSDTLDTGSFSYAPLDGVHLALEAKKDGEPDPAIALLDYACICYYDPVEKTVAVDRFLVRPKEGTPDFFEMKMRMFVNNSTAKLLVARPWIQKGPEGEWTSTGNICPVDSHTAALRTTLPSTLPATWLLEDEDDKKYYNFKVYLYEQANHEPEAPLNPVAVEEFKGYVEDE